MAKSVFSTKEKLASTELSDLLIEVSETDRIVLQELLLDMYKDLLVVCNKYNITPFLVGGSALGAVRHKGFIPWDDDLDIGMSRADYNVLKNVFENELGEKYIFNAPNISEKVRARFPQMLRKGTVCREIGDYFENENCGVKIDIFIIDNIPNNNIHKMAKGIRVNMLNIFPAKYCFMKILAM